MMMKASRKIRSEEMFFAGFGGQGIMFMGKLLAAAGVLDGYRVTWMPSYGAEVRGGTAHSMIKISEGEIASPVVKHPDILVAMNNPSYLKYRGTVKEGGMMIVNRSLVDEVERAKGIEIVRAPLTAAAAKLGDARVANMIAVGAIVKRSKLISLKSFTRVLEEAFKDKEDLLQLNKKAVEKGSKL